MRENQCFGFREVPYDPTITGRLNLSQRLSWPICSLRIRKFDLKGILLLKFFGVARTFEFDHRARHVIRPALVEGPGRLLTVVKMDNPPGYRI